MHMHALTSHHVMNAAYESPDIQTPHGPALNPCKLYEKRKTRTL